MSALRRVSGRPAHRLPLWQPLTLAVLLTYAAYFTYGAFLTNTHSGTSPAEGRLAVESCEPNRTVLGLRSSCSGTITRKEGFESRSNRYDREFSQFGASDVGKRTPVYPGGSGDWQPKYRESAPRWPGGLVLSLAIGALVTTFHSIVLTILAVGAARSSSQRSSHGSTPDR